MRMIDLTEITTVWCPVAKHIRGINKVLADGISRWPADQVHDKINQLTGEQAWKYHDIGSRGKDISEVVLQEPFPKRRLDDKLWSVITERENSN